MATSSATDAKIKKVWDLHVKAHDNVDKELMAATYSDSCYISYYNVATKERKEFRGVEGKKAFAEEHLDSLMMNDGKPTTDIKVKNNFHGNTLFNQWNIKSSHYSYKDGADTFVFGGDDMLITCHYQWYFGTKLVDAFESTGECFKAHHEAVVRGDVAGVINTFTEDVVVSLYNIATDKREEYVGHEKATEFYTKFLKLLEGKEVIEEEGSQSESPGPEDSKFFAYKVPDAGIKKANDVFIFSGSEKGNKINTLWMSQDFATTLK